MSAKPSEGEVKGNDSIRARTSDGQEVLLDSSVISQSFDNSSHWSTPTVDGWIEAAHRETDFEKRHTIYQEIQRAIQEEGATIIPLFRPVLMAKSRAVVGFNQNPTGYLDFAGIELMRE